MNNLVASPSQRRRLLLLGPVYGVSSAPNRWLCTWDKDVQMCGFEKARQDQCVYVVREDGVLVGILGLHVDDCCCGGGTPGYP